MRKQLRSNINGIIGAEEVLLIANGDVSLGWGDGDQERELVWVIKSERGDTNTGRGDFD